MEHTCELIRQAKEGSRAARDQLVEENTGLIWSVVKRYMGRGYDKEDLFQIGSIGLLKCIDCFDLDRGVRFSTYAVPLIVGEIKRFLRDDGMVKVSRNLKEIAGRVRRATEEYQGNFHRAPTLQEIAAVLDLDEGEIVLAMESCQEVSSLHQVIYQGDGEDIHLVDRLESDADEIESATNRILLGELLRTLSEKERSLIEMRYFQNRTQTDVAGALGISQVQVSRLEKKILQKMRGALYA